MVKKKAASLIASQGGKARAAKLSSDQRSEIAKRAADKRWGKDKPKATHAGILKIGEAEINCYVLENGKRIISTRGMMKALGRSWRGRKYSGTELPVFLEASNLKPFISNDLEMVLSAVEFTPPNGATAEGFEADLLRLTCEAYLSARDAGVLTKSQEPLAKQADILMRGFAKVGIVALVDEATGYERDKAKNELLGILEAFVAKEIQKWIKTFEIEFYELICELRNEPIERATKRPAYFGKLTNNLVYYRLAPGVLEQLQKDNPVVEGGYRRRKHFQHLTPDIGHPRLKLHLEGVTTVMKIAKAQRLGWEGFLSLLNQTHPTYKEMPLFDLLDDEQDGEPNSVNRF